MGLAESESAQASLRIAHESYTALRGLAGLLQELATADEGAGEELWLDSGGGVGVGRVVSMGDQPPVMRYE
jgi:hypothetical protein